MISERFFFPIFITKKVMHSRRSCLSSYSRAIYLSIWYVMAMLNIRAGFLKQRYWYLNKNLKRITVQQWKPGLFLNPAISAEQVRTTIRPTGTAEFLLGVNGTSQKSYWWIVGKMNEPTEIHRVILESSESICKSHPPVHGSLSFSFFII